jgi:hypothetical protein
MGFSCYTQWKYGHKPHGGLISSGGIWSLLNHRILGLVLGTRGRTFIFDNFWGLVTASNLILVNTTFMYFVESWQHYLFLTTRQVSATIVFFSTLIN